MASGNRLSIVVPAFNEEKRVGATIREIKAFASQKGLDCEIIVVDDGSQDHTTQTVLKEFEPGNNSKLRLIKNDKNHGKGYSVRRGMLEARGDFILFTDADLSTPIEEVEKLIAAIREGSDVAIASRALPESRVEIHQNIVRETMGKIFNRIARLFTFKHIRDSQCGFKCFRREVAHRLFSIAKVDGFSFDVEIIYLAQKFGLKVREVPVVWRNSPASKVHIIRDPLKMFWDLLRIRLIHLSHAQAQDAKAKE